VIEFAENHANRLKRPIVQYYKDKFRVIGPAHLATDGKYFFLFLSSNPFQELVYPFPSWEEREISARDWDEAGIIICIVTFLCILVSIVYIVFTIKFRESAAVKADSPIFLIIIVVGAILIQCVCFIEVALFFSGSNVTAFSFLCHLR